MSFARVALLSAGEPSIGAVAAVVLLVVVVLLLEQELVRAAEGRGRTTAVRVFGAAAAPALLAFGIVVVVQFARIAE